MNFSEDLIAVQGVLSGIHKIIGDFTSIRHRGGNEHIISKIVEELRNFLSNKKYLRKDKINPKYEVQMREIHLFLILNTDFTNKSILANDNKFAHMVGVVPQLSKCLLANLVWNLDFCRFYSEAIYSLPVEISLELLEYCNACLKRGEPYLVLEHVAMISLSIYVKIYYLRDEHTDEEKVNASITKLLERFTQVLHNYLAPESDQMSTWPTVEMYQYLGVAIYKILNLLKCCFNIFVNNSIGAIHEMYQINTSGPSNSPERLDKSAQALKKCNICLISVCEANLQAVTLEVFCTWAEYKHNSALMQQAIGALAYDVREQLNNFEECGNLPQMLDAIIVKPKTVEDTIREADEETLLNNVTLPSENQYLWFKALLKHGVKNSEQIFTTFKSLAHLCKKEDFLYLLDYSITYVKDDKDLLDIILLNITNLQDDELVEIVAEYFQKYGLNNLYETERYGVQLSEFLNKLSCETDFYLPKKDIGIILLQNPFGFIARLLIESLKNLNHLSNITKIFYFIEPVCNIIVQDSKQTVLTETTLKFLKEYELEPNSEQCLSLLINSFIGRNLLVNNISEELLSIVDYSIQKNILQKAVIILRICQGLPSSVLENDDSSTIVLKLVNILPNVRWTFFTYSEEKVLVVTELIDLLRKHKNNLSSKDCLKTAADILKDQIDLFYVISDKSPFLKIASAGYDKEASHNQQVGCLLKIFPCCNPEEWMSITQYLIVDNDPLELLQLLIDVILILSEISKKSNDSQGCLSYCFQQFCVLIKNVIYPLIVEDKEIVKTFIKKILGVIKHLPKELQNTNDISLLNLFDFDVIKTMVDDKDFMYILMSISHLEVSKIICSKIIS